MKEQTENSWIPACAGMTDNKRLVSTEEAARVLGVTPRSIRRYFEIGKIQGEIIKNNKGGGKSGLVLMVWVEDPKESDQLSVINNQDEILRSAQNDKKMERYRVNRGEPGGSIVTPMKNGMPILNTPAGQAGNAELLEKINPTTGGDLVTVGQLIVKPQLESPPQQNIPMILDSCLRRNDKMERIGNLRFAVIQKFNDELTKEDPNLPLFKDGDGNGHRSKIEIIRKFLTLYNRGILLPEIHDEIGSISRATLYNWVSAIEQDGINALIPNYGGPGRSKITEHEKNLVLTLCLHQNRLKVAYAITLAKEYLKKKNFDSPSSPATLRRFIDQFKREHFDIWVLKREGEKALNDKVIPYAERDWNLLEVGEGLVADGHRLNFQIIHPITGKPCRAALVLFWDWKSSYPLGWEIMIEENIQCVASALRNSILTLGKIPKWIYLDNGKAFKAKIFTEDIDFEDGELPGMFARLNINYHFAQPYNAQSKPIERIFGILNEQLERLIPSYTGASIEDKPAYTKRNEKLARVAHNPWVPTIQETNDLIRAWRDRYAERSSRGRDGMRPIDIFHEGKGPGVDPLGLTFLMMDRDIKHVHRNGVTWLGWHWYNEALYGLKDRVVIRYSLCDLSQIYIFHKNEFLCMAKPVEKVHPMASESESPKDMEAVKEIFHLKNKVKGITHRLTDLLETKAASQIDWSKTKSSEIVETIQKIEEAKNPKVIKLSPFVKNVESVNAEEIQDIPDESGRPFFYSDCEKFYWLMKQPGISPEDQMWLDDLTERTPIYKQAIAER